jgi:hypothetical protein
MNVRLQYDMDFMAGIWYENQLQMNQYSISMNLVTQTTNASATNIAMDRLKYFVQIYMQNTVFINQDRLEVAEMLKTMGINITTLPGEPVDQLIGIMLYCKLNSIMEGRMIVTSLDLSSVLGDSVWYRHDDEDALGPFVNDDWWNRASTQHDIVDLEPATEKVVKVTTQGWHEIGLEWEDETTVPVNNSIVYVDFSQREN